MYNSNIMKKKLIVGTLGSLLLLFGITASGDESSNIKPEISDSNITSSVKTIKKVDKPTCDGTTTTTNCALDNVNYKTYIYHAAIPEKSHTEIVTTYKEEITGYCTLCNDGTYSPSCATGRGACSHHGGVAQWNAPISAKVPISTTKTVIDTPAQDAYYEKVTE